jgi:hypothetical protein
MLGRGLQAISEFPLVKMERMFELGEGLTPVILAA